MNQFFSKMSIPMNEHLYLKDPTSSDLGQKILRGSISLISSLGFEKFTFKKLAVEIDTTEASIYRYFESKHKILLYLINWYWSCMWFRIHMGTQNITNAEVRLKNCIHILTAIPNPTNELVLDNELELKQIVINESSKVLLTKNVDDENKNGAFAEYKKVVEFVSAIILEINPSYSFPNMLISTMIEGSNQQRFFAAHLPRLTNINQKDDLVESFFTDTLLKAIKNEK
jgi:AcrR family transcriptional regulator